MTLNVNGGSSDWPRRWYDQHARERANDDDEQHERAMRQRPLGEIEATPRRRARADRSRDMASARAGAPIRSADAVRAASRDARRRRRPSYGRTDLAFAQLVHAGRNDPFAVANARTSRPRRLRDTAPIVDGRRATLPRRRIVDPHRRLAVLVVDRRRAAAARARPIARRPARTTFAVMPHCSAGSGSRIDARTANVRVAGSTAGRDLAHARRRRSCADWPTARPHERVALRNSLDAVLRHADRDFALVLARELHRPTCPAVTT